MGFRRLLVAAIGVAALSLLGPTVAGAQTGVATLTGEHLNACHGGEVGGAGLGCGVQETGPESVRMQCSGDRVTWSASGIATGPYPGTFTETGSADNETLTVEFHIDSALGDVDGRKFLGPESSVFTGCEDFDGVFTEVEVFGAVRYEAIIKPPSGGSFADEGRSDVSVFGIATAPGAETTIGIVSEDFVSTLPFAEPIRPTAKEQCKDEGFLIFGVFENQGDCVSFVSTKGKNEPGQNVP